MIDNISFLLNINIVRIVWEEGNYIVIIGFVFTIFFYFRKHYNKNQKHELEVGHKYKKSCIFSINLYIKLIFF